MQLENCHWIWCEYFAWSVDKMSNKCSWQYIKKIVASHFGLPHDAVDANVLPMGARKIYIYHKLYAKCSKHNYRYNTQCTAAWFSLRRFAMEMYESHRRNIKPLHFLNEKKRILQFHTCSFLLVFYKRIKNMKQFFVKTQKNETVCNKFQ